MQLLITGIFFTAGNDRLQDYEIFRRSVYSVCYYHYYYFEILLFRKSPWGNRCSASRQLIPRSNDSKSLAAGVLGLWPCTIWRKISLIYGWIRLIKVEILLEKYSKAEFIMKVELNCYRTCIPLQRYTVTSIWGNERKNKQPNASVRHNHGKEAVGYLSRQYRYAQHNACMHVCSNTFTLPEVEWMALALWLGIIRHWHYWHLAVMDWMKKL